jgi:hypothetical protein
MIFILTVMKNLAISQDLYNFSLVVSVFILVVCLIKYNKQIKPLLNHIIVVLALIAAIYVLYLYTLWINTPTSILLLPVLYILLKIITFISENEFSSRAVKGVGYFILGMLNLHNISGLESQGAIMVVFFVSAMCFFECIDAFFELINLLKKSSNKKNTNKAIGAPGI